MLYVYAFVPEALAVDDLRGVSGEALTSLRLGEGTFAIIGEVSVKPALDVDGLRTQDRVVGSLHDRAAALLPARFGTVVADAAALEGHPRLQHGALAPAFALVRGREQMTVRMVTTGSEAAPGDAPQDQSSGETPGRAYLEAKARAARMPEALRVVSERLQPLVRDEIFARGPTAAMVGTLYHLIDRGTSADYVRAAADARPAPPMALHVSGPAAAYAFARREVT